MQKKLSAPQPPAPEQHTSVIEEEKSVPCLPQYSTTPDNPVQIKQFEQQPVVQPVAIVQELIHQQADEQIVEFEQALIVITAVRNIANPCKKRTMTVGPKKFVGKVPNAQIHIHTNTKKTHNDFDTLSLVHASSQQTTQAHSRAGRTATAKSFVSGSTMAAQQRYEEYDTRTQSDSNKIPTASIIKVPQKPREAYGAYKSQTINRQNPNVNSTSLFNNMCRNSGEPSRALR